MIEKKPLIANRVRKIAGSFATIEHHFLRGGFWASLTQHELLLYFFLVLACDRQGLSYYSFDKICSLVGLTPDEYILARNSLIEKDLLAFDGLLFQVLSLPEHPACASTRLLCCAEDMAQADPATVSQIIKRSLRGTHHDR